MIRSLALLSMLFHTGLVVADTMPAKVGTISDASTGQHYLMQLTSGLVIVLLCIIVLAWLAKRFNRLQSTPDGSLEIVSGLSVGARERIVLVKAGRRHLLIGVSPGQVSALCELDQDETDALDKNHEGAVRPDRPFIQLLADKMNSKLKRSGDSAASAELQTRRNLRDCR